MMLPRSGGRGIFVSYRRTDSAGFALALYKILAQRFGRSHVFMDVDSIEPGSDFRDTIRRTLLKCDVMLVLIGRGWISAMDDRGRRRLRDPDDFVRLEIETALNRGIRVIPLLVDGATMPSIRELPEGLVVLLHRQVHRLDAEGFDRDVQALMAVIDRNAPRKRPSWSMIGGAVLAAVVAGAVMRIGTVDRTDRSAEAIRSDDGGEEPAGVGGTRVGDAPPRVTATRGGSVPSVRRPVPNQARGPAAPRFGRLGGGSPTVEQQPCVLPMPAERDFVVLVGASGGTALSSTTITGQDDETRTAAVTIEPGDERLYIVLAAYTATIWRFDGYTSRVGHLTLVGGRAQGVVGLHPGAVTEIHSVDTVADHSAPYIANTRCFPSFTEVRSKDAIIARGVVERAIGRRVDVVRGVSNSGTIHLPSGQVDEEAFNPADQPVAPPGLDPEVYAHAIGFDRIRIVDIDPRSVVSSLKAERYDVLPSELGLAQLVASGALEKYGDSFLIARPIPRFPAGLSGALSVNFILGKGVPMPPGNPGYACIISEETGLPLNDSPSCR